MAEASGAKPSITLPRWQSHKVVEADKIVGFVVDTVGDMKWILANGAAIAVSNELANRVPGPNPVGGYYVRYDGGDHESWSPAKPFEDGYTRLP